MQIKKIDFSFEEYDDIDALSLEDRTLLKAAQNAVALSYAPYSKFQVGAAALLSNGKTVLGSNQENASSPVGICAERVLLSTLSSLYNEEAIQSIAISYKNLQGRDNTPISPCGICRQSLLEFELRTQQAMRIILGGQSGNVLIVSSAKALLPLSFTPEDLG